MKTKVFLIALAALAASHSVAVARDDAAGRELSPQANEQVTSRSHLRSSLNWAKERLDEMDATLALFEREVGEVQGDARATAEEALADMRAKRDAFREAIRKEEEMSEADWNRATAALEHDWSAFEASVKTYVDAAGVKVEQQKTAFGVRADAQRRAWQEAIKKFE